MANVLVNAAKYTPDGGEICVRSYVDRGEVVVEVSDNGIGIAPEFLPRIFDLFAQAERGLDRSQGGLGVGLTVCKQIIEMHGGTVGASSPGWDRGATFTFRLPLAERPTPATATPPPQPDALLRVMIVDDNRDAADSLSMLLQFEGRRTLCAYSGEQALQDVAAFDPQLVLLDIGLPGLDGYEVARRLKTIVARAARDRAERLWPGSKTGSAQPPRGSMRISSSPSTSTRSSACSRAVRLA